MEKAFLVFCFGCLCCFILFSSLFPPKAISWDFFFCAGESVFVWVFVCLFVFRLGYFIYFLCFEPPEAISSGLLLAFLPLKRFRGTSPSFVLEEAFWLMLGTVFALFQSIFFACASSIRISRVGVPPGLELGLARTL